MDSEDEVIFCEDDFTSESFSAFEHMRRNQELTDYTITLENRCIVGHKLVLAARIPYFREVFFSSNEVILKEEDREVLELIFDFAYSGKIKITNGNVRSLLATSKSLQLTRVYDACWEFLEGRLHLENVLEIRRLAEDNHCSRSLEVADNYIRQNFVEFANSRSFLDFRFQYLKELIRRDDIRVSKEEPVFEAVIRWVKTSPSERWDLLPKLLSCVRMHYLPREYLARRVTTDELVKSSHSCRDLVQEAINYYLMGENRSEFCLLPYHPRNFYEFLPLQKSQYHPSQDDKTARILFHAVIEEESTLLVKLFDPEEETWLELSSYDSLGDIEAVVSMDAVIYIFLNLSILTFDVISCKWNSSDYEHSVQSSGSVTHDGVIYFFGGLGEASSKVRAFQPGRQRLLRVDYMPKPVQHPGVALLSSSRGSSSSLETFIYVTGGIFEGNTYNTVERYEFGKWTEVSSMLSKRYGHGCCNMNEKIYVCGGQVISPIPLKSIEVYDPLTNEWNEISSMRMPRFMLSVVSGANKLYLCGQRSVLSVGECEMEIYDPGKKEWKTGVNIPDVSKSCGIFLVKSVVS